jgi:CheY-like chemotaxis protein
VKFTEKGYINVSAAIRSMESTTEGEKVYVALEVTDTGIGIAPDKLDMIFEKFTQADASISRTYGGTGLGLAIARTLAELMGGTIELQSAVNQGSIFTVVLPLMPERRKTPRDADPASQTGKGSAGHILLVEDNEANALVATTILEQFGYTFDVASNGEDAIAKVRSNNYGVVLMDLQMPGMSGLEVTSLIRQYEADHAVPHVHILGMTAHALAGYREKCLQAGMDDYISKPFNPDELHAKLHEALKPALV